MNNQQLLDKAAQVIHDTGELLATLDDAPAFVRNRSDVQLARATAVKSRDLVIELVRRVRADIGGKHGNEEQAGARLPAVS